MPIISIAGLKGGSGRSTTCVQIATYFAKNLKVCIVDTDTNQSCAKWSGIRDEDLVPVTVIGILDNKQLSKNINKIKDDYDIVLLDGSPTMSSKASYLILLADIVIIPTPADGFSLWAQEIFIERYLEAVQLKGKEIPAFFLMSMFNPRIKLHKEFRETLKAYEEYGIKTFKSYMEYRVEYRTTIIQGKSALEGSNKKAIKEINGICSELKGIIKKL